MSANRTSNANTGKTLLARMAPGLGVLAAYNRDWLRHDLIAGVSVAAVALPTAIAYPTLKSAMSAFLALQSGPLTGVPEPGNASAGAEANGGQSE